MGPLRVAAWPVVGVETDVRLPVASIVPDTLKVVLRPGSRSTPSTTPLRLIVQVEVPVSVAFSVFVHVPFQVPANLSVPVNDESPPHPNATAPNATSQSFFIGAF